MFSKTGTLFVALAVVIAGVFIYLDYTPVAVDRAPSNTRFSVQRAALHLRQIASKPHSIGTVEKGRVRDYIMAQCGAMGLDTLIQHSTSVVGDAVGVSAGDIEDVIALYKGSDSMSGKKSAVLVMAHYDSEPNAVGAGDDGAGCAAMLETVRLIKAGPRLKNDIIFLFTDGEEAGLLGATSFARENPLMSEVAVVLNFDGRGNAGKSFMVSNGSSSWMVDEYRRACAHRSASSLFHELFRVLPNSTDLLPFSNKSIPGLDFAYIDGFVNYHAMTDRPENMDERTLQEHGDNMLSLVKHFAGIGLRDRKPGEKTFFNFLGNAMTVYPVEWNKGFLAATNLLFLAWVIIGMINRRVRWQGFLAGVLSFAVVLVLLYFVASFALQGVRAAYPLYGGYYSNAYNSKYFYLAVIALVVAVFTLIYQGVLRKFDLPSVLAGLLLLEIGVLDFLYTVIPTAIYFLCFPVLFLLISCVIGYSRKLREPREAGMEPREAGMEPREAGIEPRLSGTRMSALFLAGLLPALLLLAPLIYGLFIGFDVQAEAAALGVLTGILLGLLIPLFAAAFLESRWLIPACAFLLCMLGTGFGVLHNKFSAAKPYKTNLRYVVNSDDSSAFWVLRYTPVDAWSRRFLPHPVKGHPGYDFGGFQGGTVEELINKTEYVDFSPPELTVKSDSVTGGVRKLLLHCAVFDGAVSAHFDLDSTCLARNILVNGVGVEGSEGGGKGGSGSGGPRAGSGGETGRYRWLDISGRWPDGFDVLFELDPKTPFRCHAISRIMGLPAVQGFAGYPANMIPGPGIFSNTTMVGKYYQFVAP